MSSNYELGGMRTLTFAFLVLVPILGNTCSLTSIIEPACERDPASCVRRDLLDLYQRADVVLEVTVHKIRLTGHSRSLNSVTVNHVWKTDGKALDLIEAGRGGGDCTIALSVGTTYVIFAQRSDSLWSFLPWVNEPLYAGIARTFESREFKASSPYHSELYASKSPETLQMVLKKLAP